MLAREAGFNLGVDREDNSILVFSCMTSNRTRISLDDRAEELGLALVLGQTQLAAVLDLQATQLPTGREPNTPFPIVCGLSLLAYFQLTMLSPLYASMSHLQRSEQVRSSMYEMRPGEKLSRFPSGRTVLKGVSRRTLHTPSLHGLFSTCPTGCYSDSPSNLTSLRSACLSRTHSMADAMGFEPRNSPFSSSELLRDLNIVSLCSDHAS